jgi:hypothetical protein
MTIVAIEDVGRRFAAEDAPKQSGQLDGVVDAEVEAKAAERVVDVGGVAGQKHATLAEARGHPLVHAVEVAVDDGVATVLGKELLQAAFGRFDIEQVGSCSSSRVDDKPATGPPSSQRP